MRICVVGTGYVGLVTGVCLAEIGYTVTCVDSNEDIIIILNTELRAPFYEPGLDELIRKNANNIDFTTSLKGALDEDPDVVLICVGTPFEDGELETRYVEAVCREIAEHPIQTHVVIKSTVPPGTCRYMDTLIRNMRVSNDSYFLSSVIFNPEFLKEGHAIEDFRRPDRIIVGCENEFVGGGFGIMRDLYSPFIRNGHTYLEMGWESAEMTKLAANAMLATRISFMNEMAGICENVGADIMDVRDGIGSDSRIGMQFLYAGLGFGGSCFPKDVSQLSKLTDPFGEESRILHGTLVANGRVRTAFLDKIVYACMKRKSVEDKSVIAVWGLSFKPKTSDTRMAPAVWLIGAMVFSENIAQEVRVYDPEASTLPLELQDERIVLCSSKYDACKGAHALVLCTEWAEFRKPDWHAVKNFMAEHRVFDGRNQWNPEELRRLGFDYHGIGRGSST